MHNHSGLWIRRLIEIVCVIALIAEGWRFFTTKNTSMDFMVDAIELVGLIIVAAACIYVEMHDARSSKGM
ncbi:MAG: hypothetical protein M3Y81_02370 [Chloroflexota bacterium]|nr:hypothetical protein [Chloroflexota bacterium]